MLHVIEQSFLRDLETHKQGDAVTVSQQYHIDCFRTYRAIVVSVEKLEIAQECTMQSYMYAPQDQKYARLIEFHIENYFIRSRGVYDRVLIFTNSLCDIQMSHDHIGHNSIITNRKVIDMGLKSSLKSINGAYSVYRNERNTAVHKNKYNDENLSWVDTALKAKAMMSDENFKESGLTDLQISKKAANSVSKHMKEFKSNTKSITDRLCVYLNLARSVYETNRA